MYNMVTTVNNNVFYTCNLRREWISSVLTIDTKKGKDGRLWMVNQLDWGYHFTMYRYIKTSCFYALNTCNDYWSIIPQ